MKTFEQELQELINRHSKENDSDTPDFILAEYIGDCLQAFNKATNTRTGWYGGKSLTKEDHNQSDVLKDYDNRETGS